MKGNMTALDLSKTYGTDSHLPLPFWLPLLGLSRLGSVNTATFIASHLAFCQPRATRQEDSGTLYPLLPADSILVTHLLATPK